MLGPQRKEKRDLGQHSGWCWVGHGPDCTCVSPQRGQSHGIPGRHCILQQQCWNTVHASFLFIPLISVQSPPLDMGATVNKISLLKKHLKLSRDTLTCYCWLDAIAQFSKAIKDMIIQKWTYIRTIWTSLMLIVMQILKRLSERSHMDLILYIIYKQMCRASCQNKGNKYVTCKSI